MILIQWFCDTSVIKPNIFLPILSPFDTDISDLYMSYTLHNCPFSSLLVPAFFPTTSESIRYESETPESNYKSWCLLCDAFLRTGIAHVHCCQTLHQFIFLSLFERVFGTYPNKSWAKFSSFFENKSNNKIYIYFCLQILQTSHWLQREYSEI